MNFKYAFFFTLIFFSTSSYGASGDVFFVDKNHPSASDSNPGTESQPWLTIQKAADTLTAGETVYVKEGVYTEHTAGNGQYGGIIPKNSGALNAPITYQTYSGDSVVIDQNDSSPGFYLQSKNHIIIKGFEIRNAYSGGIRLANQSVPRNSFITIEENYIHNITGPWGHNVGGVRLDSCDRCVVRNNTIHDVSITTDPQTNSAGIHSYRMSNATIENNTIWNSYNGIFFKQAQFDGEPGGTIRRNIFHNISEGIRLTPQGSNFPGHQEIHIKENIFYKFSRGIKVRVSETSTQSSGLYISNNTFADGVPYSGTPTPECLVLNGYTNTQIWNNICVAEIPIELYHIAPPFNFTGDVTYMDFNLYHSYTSFRIDRYGRFQTPVIPYLQFSSIDEWRTNATASATMVSPPDINSITSPPLFMDPINRNYKLQTDSQAKSRGRNGEDIGAYSSSTIFIGASNSFSDAPKRPSSPSLLMVN